MRINRNLDALVAASHAPPYNASTHASELDYFTDLLYRAKLAPHREQLLRLLGAWHAGETPLHVPLKRVEELIDQNVLQPDTLLISGDNSWIDDASYYKYDEHDGGGEPGPED